MKQGNTDIDIDEQLVRRYIPPLYRKCYVHLTDCTMKHRKTDPKLSINFKDLQSFKVVINSRDNKRTVQCVGFDSDKLKLEETISKEDNTSTDSPKNPSVAEKVDNGFYDLSQSGNSVGNDDISRNSLIDDTEPRHKRRKSSTGGKQHVGENHSDSCKNKFQFNKTPSKSKLPFKRRKQRRSASQKQQRQVEGNVGG